MRASATRLRSHTSLASDGCDERGDAENDGGAHVDDAGDDDVVMVGWADEDGDDDDGRSG